MMPPRLFLLSSLTIPLSSVASVDVQLGWESQYISEGRRGFDEAGGLFTGTVGGQTGPWFYKAWNGVSASADFWELDTTVGGVLEWGSVELSTGYTLVKVWLDGGEDKPDHEWFLGAAFPLYETTEASVDLVYGHLSGGSYLECVLTQALPAPQGFDWSAFGTLAWDFGYASKAFDGISHTHLGTEIALPLGADWTGVVYYVLTIPFEDLKQDDGVSTGSIGFSVSREF